jgi:asparagine synthase (glutamine-hydrolysing)
LNIQSIAFTPKNIAKPKLIKINSLIPVDFNKHVLKKLMSLPKSEFSVPIESWLRSPLLDWAESFQGGSRLKLEGYFNSLPIRQKWEEYFMSVKRNWREYLWDVFLFYAFRG